MPANGEFRKSLKNIFSRFKVEPGYYILNYAIFTDSWMAIRDDICWKVNRNTQEWKNIYICVINTNMFTFVYIYLHIQSLYLIPCLASNWNININLFYCFVSIYSFIAFTSGNLKVLGSVLRFSRILILELHTESIRFTNNLLDSWNPYSFCKGLCTNPQVCICYGKKVKNAKI